jgi:hypothetical protein
MDEKSFLQVILYFRLHNNIFIGENSLDLLRQKCDLFRSEKASSKPEQRASQSQ